MTIQYQGVWSLQSAAQLQSTQQWVTDPLFKNTTLLLQADDAANGAQNNTFLDSSSNAFAITRNPASGPNAPTQGSFTPFSLQPGAWGNYFSGSGNGFLNAVSNAVFAFGTGDFTLEAFINVTAYPSSGTAAGNIISAHNWNGSGFDFTFRISQTGLLFFENSAGNTLTSSTAVSLNSWVHVACVRSSGTLTFYINGSSAGSGAASGSMGSTVPISIGAATSGGTFGNFTGYISNARITKGGALYTSTFTPSTTPLTTTVSSGTVSLLTCQSNRFVDNSVNAFALTAGAGASVQAFSPFAPQFQWTPSVIGGSGYFDGTGDWLTVPSNTALTLSTGAFTLEFWAYCTNFSSATRSWLSNRNGTETNRWGIDSSTSGTFYLYGNGGFVVTSTAVAPNQWVHVCVTRANTSTNGVRIFINGRLDAVGTSATDFAADIVSIGASPSGSQPSIGYIANARIIKGSIPTDYQTSSTTTGTQVFTPPSAPSTTTSQGATSSNVSLLTNFTNAGIYDGTMKNNLETVGNAQISTAVVKYGSGSMAFDGTGDYLTSYNAGGLFRLGTVYTVEMWFYTTTVAAGNAGLINFATTISGNTGFNLYRSSAEILCNDGATGGTGPSSGAGSVVANVWTHLAIVSNGVTTKVYLDGVERGSYTGTTGSANSMTYVTIGSFNDKTANFSGYIDDLRVTSGIARYTQNFIPPSVALPRQ